jgi:two-component system cell cycle response regulator
VKNILVIDDLPENVFMLQDRLEHEGYEVLTAYDGKSGINKAISDQPDLILLDVMMPEMNGIEVCKTLVNNPSTTNIPIILVTAKAGAEDTKEGLEAGAFDYIKKPFNKVELMARINSALKLADAHRKYLEAEQKNTFAATVVTANHRIKQPLTLMSLSSAALKREINKDQISKEALIKRLNYIDTAIKEISDVLNQLNAIKKPILTDYVKDIKMVECENEETKEEVVETREESDKLLNS